nr:DUF2156 domain-containing protein [Synergistaceae bacterium]
MDFKPLSFDLKAQYDKYFAACPVKYCEYSFFSLWGWRDAALIELAFDDENNLCWVKSQNLIYGPVGSWRDNNINWRKIFEDNFNNNFELYDVPEDAANLIKNALSNATLSEERDQWEYVYSVNDLIKLKGSKFSHKRNRVRTFESSYEFDYMPLTPDDFKDVLNFQECWREHRDETMTDSEAASLLVEDKAVRTAIEYWDKFPLLGGMIKIDDKIIAYTIAEVLDENNLDIRFEKAFGEYAGSYQAINNFFLRDQGAKFKWVNREEDMGELGLREAKLSYNPEFMLKKYRIKI